MGWREPDDTESIYIKKHISSGERLGLFCGIGFVLLLIAGVVRMFITMMDKGSIPFSIFSIIVQLITLGLAGFIIWMMGEFIRKIREVRAGRYQMCECEITSIRIDYGYKKSTGKITVYTDHGKSYTVRSANTYGPNAKKGKLGYVVKFDSEKIKDYSLVVRKERAE